MADITKKQFAFSALWKILEQFSTKGISMLVSIVLARILSPDDYGLIALTGVFTNLSDVLIDGGFSTALIRKDKVDEYDYACVFSISSTIAAVLYLLLFFGAPYVSAYYSEPALTAVLRVVGLTFFIQAFSSTRTAVVNRNMQFKFLFYCNALSSVISGVVGIAAAYGGLGVWALVVQRLLQQVLLTVLLFIKIKWRVRWRFDSRRLKGILYFSLGVVGASLLNYLGGNLYNVIIAKIYSVTDLGYYDKGCQLPMQLSLYTFGALSSVLLPTLASSQHDLEKVKAILRKVTAMTSYLIMPIMMGLAFTSKELIVLLFTDKWLPSVPVMQFNCLYYLATPYMLINVQVFFALGRSGLRVKTEIIRLLLMFSSVILFAVYKGSNINMVAFVSALIAVLSALVAYIEVQQLIKYRPADVLRDTWKPLVASLLMGMVLLICQRLFSGLFGNYFLSLFIKVIIGCGVYLILSICMKMEGFNEVTGMLKGMINGRKAHE